MDMQKVKHRGLVIIAIIAIGFIALGAYLLSIHAPMQSFSNISGLDVGLGASSDRVIEAMGAPREVETIERDCASDLFVFHYDGVSFFFRNDSNEIVFFDITSEQYRLGGRGMSRVGVGSERSEVEADFERRRENSRWRDTVSRYTYREMQSPHNGMDGMGFGYYCLRLWVSVEFEFENGIVTKMRIGFAI